MQEAPYSRRPVVRTRNGPGADHLGVGRGWLGCLSLDTAIGVVYFTCGDWHSNIGSANSHSIRFRP